MTWLSWIAAAIVVVVLFLIVIALLGKLIYEISKVTRKTLNL